MSTAASSEAVSARWTCVTDFDKWDADQTRYVQDATGLFHPQAAQFEALGVTPVEHIHIPAPANRLTTVGLDAMTKQLIGTAARPWDNTHTGLAVGDSATADAIGNTDLSGTASTGVYYMSMDATYPTQANGVLTLKATYGSGIAEYAWNEYGATINTGTVTVMAGATSKNANYTLLNRKAPAALGTKGAGTTWAFTMSLTIV